MSQNNNTNSQKDRHHAQDTHRGKHPDFAKRPDATLTCEMLFRCQFPVAFYATDLVICEVMVY